MAKKKKASPKKAKPHKKPTSARLLKNRPADTEPPETDAEVEIDPETGEPTSEEEDLETPDKPKRKARQARLPGTEDAAIEELEGLAEEYAAARDKRMAIGEDEVKLKSELLEAMKKYEKVKYFHAGVLIEVINSKDKVKVRINKDRGLMAIPDNRKDLEAMGYSFNGEGECRGCGADLLWFVTPRGKKMPMSRIADQGPADDTEKLEAHWGVCPEREQFRKPK